MKALVCQKLGNPLSAGADQPLLEIIDRPCPASLGSQEVRIRVKAASLNFADALQIQGQYQEKPKLPFIPGSEVSGTVTEIGVGVRTVQVGDKVCAVSKGAFAEECVAHEGAVLSLPDGVDVVEAAGLPVAFGTAHLALQERARLEPGQVVLVLGAAGGVGIAAVQLAKCAGAVVIAVARGPAKAEALRRLGADFVVDTSDPKQKLPAAVKAHAPKGVDVIFDPVGGSAFSDALKVARWGAQILIIGFASGTIPKIAANIALVKNLTFHGIYWGSYMQHKPRVLRRSLEELVQLYAEGKIRVQVSHRYPLGQYSEAFKALMNREAIGKVLLVVEPQSRL